MLEKSSTKIRSESPLAFKNEVKQLPIKPAAPVTTIAIGTNLTVRLGLLHFKQLKDTYISTIFPYFVVGKPCLN